MNENRNLSREMGIIAGAWRGKDGLYNEGRLVCGRGGSVSRESLCRRSRSKHDRVNGDEHSPGVCGESWFLSKSGQS